MPKLFQHKRKKLLNNDGVKKYIFYALGEIALVIIGILIALQINNWNESRKNQNQQTAILVSVKDEIKSNLEAIQKVQTSRSLFFTSLDSISSNTPESRLLEKFYDLPTESSLPKWRGAAPVSLNDAMFEAAKYNQSLSEIEVKLLKQLSYVYNRQAQINQLGAVLLEKFFDIDRDAEYREVIRLMWRIQEEFFGAQYLLMPEYEKTIMLIDNYLSK